MISSLPEDRTARIAFLNDALRTTLAGGTVCVTAGLNRLGEKFVVEALQRVSRFESFDPENDPHGEHDFGDVVVEGRALLWKIDYFDKAIVFGSEDPADPKKTHRVLTIMLEEDY